MGVRLVREQPHGATVPIRVELEQRRQLGLSPTCPAVSNIATGAQAPVDEGVDLRGPPASGTSQCVIGGLACNRVIRLTPCGSGRWSARRVLVGTHALGGDTSV